MVLSQSLKVMMEIIQLLFAHVCVCFLLLDVLGLYMSCWIKISSLSATASSDIYLEDFWSDSKEDNFIWVEQLKTDSFFCDLSVFISKLSECKQVEFSAAVLATFVHLKYSCGTWMISESSSSFTLSSLKLCYNSLSFSISMSHSSPIFIKSPFLFSIIWHNFSISSIVFVVTLSLAEFISLLWYSLSHLIFKKVEIFRVASFRIILSIRSCKLRNWFFSYFWSRFPSLSSFSA